MNKHIRRMVWSLSAALWLALVVTPAHALVAPEPGGGPIAPPPVAPGTSTDTGTSLVDRIPWMAAGAGLILAVVVLAWASVLLSRSHHLPGLHPSTH